MPLTDRTRPVVMQFTRLFNAWKAYERLGHQLAGHSLTSGELQVIRVVAEFPERGASALAEQLGVTKGAFSQSVTKLVGRGFLERIRGAADERVRLTRLTAIGERVYAEHLARFEHQLGVFDELLGSADGGQIEFLLEVVGRVEVSLRDLVRQSDQRSGHQA